MAEKNEVQLPCERKGEMPKRCGAFIKWLEQMAGKPTTEKIIRRARTCQRLREDGFCPVERRASQEKPPAKPSNQSRTRGNAPFPDLRLANSRSN